MPAVLFARGASSSNSVMFSQPWTCCPPSSSELVAIRSINDSPSKTLEHHMHFHLPKSNSNTLNARYLIPNSIIALSGGSLGFHIESKILISYINLPLNMSLLLKYGVKTNWHSANTFY